VALTPVTVAAVAPAKLARDSSAVAVKLATEDTVKRTPAVSNNLRLNFFLRAGSAIGCSIF
jgi:hypothetical protein